MTPPLLLSDHDVRHRIHPRCDTYHPTTNDDDRLSLDRRIPTEQQKDHYDMDIERPAAVDVVLSSTRDGDVDVVVSSFSTSLASLPPKRWTPPPPLSSSPTSTILTTLPKRTVSSRSHVTTSTMVHPCLTTSLPCPDPIDDDEEEEENDRNTTWIPPSTIRTTSTSTNNTTPTPPPPPPSSEYVLNVAFYSFVGFMIVQGFVAYYIAHSSAMMADCEAMSIDALTYLFNLLAEQQKNRVTVTALLTTTTTMISSNGNTLPQQQQYRKALLTKCYYEFIPPLLSVVALMIVTIYTIQTSMVTIVQTHYDYYYYYDDDSPIKSPRPEDGTSAATEDVSIPIMLLFSLINLGLDMVNVTCFARSGFVTTTTTTTNATTATTFQQQQPTNGATKVWTTPCTVDPVVVNTNNNERTPLLLGVSKDRRSVQKVHHHEDGPMDHNSSTTSTTIIIPLRPQDNSDCTNTTTTMTPTSSTTKGSESLNLNMCSAWTHVCADTMRSLAVVLAAGIAMCIPTSNRMDEQYYAVLADSMAALVVSIIIFISIVPLLRGIYRTGQQIRQLHSTSSSYASSTMTTTETDLTLFNGCCSNHGTSYQTINV